VGKTRRLRYFRWLDEYSVGLVLLVDHVERKTLVTAGVSILIHGVLRRLVLY
jgi:hypothetical protein